jgi:hypothetical protein
LLRLIGSGNAIYQVIERSIEALEALSGNPSKTKSKMRSPTKGANTGTTKKRHTSTAPKAKK